MFLLVGLPLTDEDDKPIQPKVGIKKKNYDARRKFQEKRVAKLPWAELFVGENGTLHIIKCRVCIEVEGKNKIFTAKWDSFCKDVGFHKVMRNMGSGVKKRDWFYSKVCKHSKN